MSPRRRRLAPANSSRLRRGAVGQTTPHAPLSILTGGIWALLPLVAARIPFALGLGFARRRVFFFFSGMLAMAGCRACPLCRHGVVMVCTSTSLRPLHR